MLVPSSIVFRPPFRQWTGNPSEQAFFDLTAARMPGSAARVLTDAAYTLVPGQAQRRGGIMPPMRILRSQLLF